MTFRVGLVNMAFAAVDLPSIALTQLASVVHDRCGEDVTTRIHYLNHDVYRHFGADVYSRISASVAATASGLGDFVFRRAAFPEIEDDADAYLKRYAWVFASDRSFAATVHGLRDGLDGFLEALIDEHELDRCDLVGFTSMFAQNLASIAVARKLKARRPDIVVVMGGANCETSMGGVLARNVGALDYVFSGPALRSFPDLVSRLEKGEREGLASIPGVLSKDRPPGGEPIGEELDIDEVVRLDYESFFESLHERCPHVSPSLLFETSRGCWWGERAHCTFCGLNGTTMSYRAMRPDAAVAQFDELFGHYPRVKHFKSVDNILPREYFEDVLPRVHPPDPSVSIFYEIKADVSGDQMATLARAGVTELQPGIEALDTRTLKLMKKGTTAHQNVAFLKSCRRFGIRPIWNLLVGFPGEPEAVYERYVAILPSLVHLPPPTGAYPVRFDRYSPYFTQAEAYGLDLVPYDFYPLLYPFPEEELGRMAYFFADRNLENPYLATTARWLSRLSEAVAEWNAKSGETPRLTFIGRGDGEVLIDSRYGTEVEHDLDSLERRILDAVESPTRLVALERSFSESSHGGLEAALARLRERCLLFEEGDRVMSLVVPSERDEGFL